MKRLLFLLTVAATALVDSLRGRRLAVNAVLTPTQTTRGTSSLNGTEAVSFKNAVVVRGADDRHYKLPALATNIPLGVLLNDELAVAEIDVLPKNIALFGLYPESLPAVAAAPIAVDAELVADLATPGRAKTLPTTTGTYVVFGRSRFAVAAAGDPVSIAHCLPRVVVVP